jgi:hypothetical protein
MEGRGFDDFVRRLAEGQSRRSVLRGLVGGGAALVAARAGSSLAAPKDKVTICHRPGTVDEETLSVANSAVQAHLGHGDSLGACSTCDCAEDLICLDNGTCARPCTDSAECEETCGVGAACFEESLSSPHGIYCYSGTTTLRCDNDTWCPEGQICLPGGLCWVAC